MGKQADASGSLASQIGLFEEPQARENVSKWTKRRQCYRGDLLSLSFCYRDKTLSKDDLERKESLWLAG